MSRLLLAAIRGYQYLLGPWWGGRCRFTPTCSEYAMDAVRERGVMRGSWLAMRRVSKCHPWHQGGFDPVPPESSP